MGALVSLTGGTDSTDTNIDAIRTAYPRRIAMTKRPPKKQKRKAADPRREEAKPHGNRPGAEARQANIQQNTKNQGYQQDR
jgi:hypothetical protein